jgi:hypothetical protein
MAFWGWPLRRWVPPPRDPPGPLAEQVRDLKQQRDIDGLIRLLKHTDPGHKPQVADALTELTGKNLGTRARIWERWRKASQADGPRTPRRWARYAAGALKAVLVAGLIKGVHWAGRRLRRRAMRAGGG